MKKTHSRLLVVVVVAVLSILFATVLYFTSSFLSDPETNKSANTVVKSQTAAVGDLILTPADSSRNITLYPNNTTINANLNANVVSQADEIVTVGIPLPDCTLYDSDDFRLFDETDTEVRVHVKSVMGWPATRQPCGVASIRVLQVQFEFDATGGAPVVYKWDLDGPRANADYGSGFDINTYEIAHDNAIKGGFMEPRVFAINDPDYLVASGLMPPTVAYTPGDHDDNYYPTMWTTYAKNFNFTTSTSGNWLFDRVSSLYRQAMRMGDVLQYREAYVSHEFYIDKIEVTGANTGEADYCVGGFDYDGKADTFGSGGDGCDSKYIYSQNIRLHLSLTGDDSWLPSDNGALSASGVIDTRDEAWNTIADVLFTGSSRCPGNSACQGPAAPAPGFSEPYDEVDDGYTERKPGLGLQTVLSSCQMTLDSTICGWVDTIVNNMYNHQTNNPDGLGNRGYLAHSWHLHEGSFVPWLGELAANYTNATSIVIDKTIADSPGSLSSDNTIRVYLPGATDINLTTDPTENPDGTWNLELETPITGSAGDRVSSSYIQPSGDVFLDIPVDRVFSPWMQSLVADAIWEYYFWTEDAGQQAKAEALLLGFGRAIAAYGLDGSRIDPDTKALVENAFGVTIFNSQITAAVGCGLTVSPHSRYVAADYMGTTDMTRDFATYMFGGGGFSDQHTPEALFQLSLGILFETDAQKKVAMQALADDAQNWYERYTCTAGPNYPPRAMTWQTKPDPFGTYTYVMNYLANDPTDYFPSVSITNPANNATVSDSVTISANASDDNTVAGVQFKIDGVNQGSEDTSSPYSISWDTTGVADGSYVITAVARDNANQTTTSGGRTVSVDNAEVDSGGGSSGGSSGGGGGGSKKKKTTDDDDTPDNTPPKNNPPGKRTSISSSYSFENNVSFNQPAFNVSDDVKMVETFLNEFEGETLPVDGVYDNNDNEAMKRFQRKYKREILDVWNLTDATGYVGITSRLKMNFLLKGQTAVCPAFTEFNGGLSGVMFSPEIGKTQEILQSLDLYFGSINNTWDSATNQALIDFQETFREVMLDPWQIDKGTGYKYKTTNKFLNYFAGCDTGAVFLEGVGEYEGI